MYLGYILEIPSMLSYAYNMYIGEFSIYLCLFLCFKYFSKLHLSLFLCEFVKSNSNKKKQRASTELFMELYASTVDPLQL